MFQELTFENKVIWVKGLMISCPLYSALPDCPLEKYRGMEIPEKFRITDEMSEEEINSVIAYHQICLKQREKRE